MEKSMFFLGICPPHPLEQRVHRLKEEFHQKYGVKGAFRSKAHITLQMPFNLPKSKEEILLSELREHVKTKEPFQVQLKDFGNFEPRVIFINVIENEELHSLQQSVQQFMKRFQVFNSTHKNSGFTPHITIAYRDLKKPTFYKIWDELKSRPFEGSFLADSLTVFKHNGKSWDVLKEIKIGNR